MDQGKIEMIKKLLESAQVNIRTAYSLLAETSPMTTNPGVDASFTNIPFTGGQQTDEGRVVEGVFDGQNMIDAEGNKYPVQANYASKSKLVAGDILKLTVQNDGKFLYKAIKRINRKNVIGILTREGNHFQVVANGRKYNVLYASVTYYKAKQHDEVTITIPADEDSEWACIENVISSNPSMDGNQISEQNPEMHEMIDVPNSDNNSEIEVTTIE